jgi:hypothetical protein
VPEWLYPIAMIIVGVLGPSLTVTGFLHRARSGELAGIKTTLSHIDGCVDELKLKVERYTAGAMTRVEVDATLLRMREAISGDTAGLHDRIMRLENPYFVKVN